MHPYAGSTVGEGTCPRSAKVSLQAPHITGIVAAREKSREICKLDIESLLKVHFWEKRKALKLLALATGIKPCFSLKRAAS